MLSTAAESTPSSDWQANHVAKAPQRRTASAPLEPAVLDRLFREARPRLLAIAQRVLGDADEAEDAVQDARVSDAEATAAEPSSAVGPAPETPERLYARAESTAVVHRALAQLPAPQSEALRLCDIDGESYATIATIARCPVGTVMSRLYHARRKLAQELGAA